MRRNFRFCAPLVCFFVYASSWTIAVAGTSTPVGNVELVSLEEMGLVQGLVLVEFDEPAAIGDPIPLDIRAGAGFLLNVGNSLQDILPNAQAASDPIPAPLYNDDIMLNLYFPEPVAGAENVRKDHYAQNILVATFTRPDVYQVGAILNDESIQYLTAFAHDGSIIGQVRYDPVGGAGGTSAAFVGFRTLNQQSIAMVTYGVSDLAGGEKLSNDIATATFASDYWVYGVTRCDFFMDPPCNDGNVCTVDSCQDLNACVFEPIVGCCLSDEDCDGNQACDLEQNVCVPDNETDTSTSDSDSDSDSGTSASESDSDSDTVSESATESDTLTEIDSLTSDSIGLALDDDGCEFCQASSTRANWAGMLGLLGLFYVYGGVRRRRRVNERS